MRILFVAMSGSVHTARWIRQLDGAGHDIHLFPSKDEGPLHPSLKGVVTYHPEFTSSADAPAGRGIPVVVPMVASAGNLMVNKLLPERRLQRLLRLIRKLKPDVVHSLELQAAGYLTSEARLRYGDAFPPWAVSNWGSDVYLFGQLPEHKQRLATLLENCDFYICECVRDVGLARNLGLTGEKFAVLPGAGGIDMVRVSPWRAVPPSRRKRILLKGYQGWAGRALCGLRAIEIAADSLAGYEIVTYLTNPEVELKARLVAERTGLAVRILPYTYHDKMLQLQGQARISMGLSISDAASTSFLEAMAMGAFPIQSDTACVEEWIIPGSTGLVVPAEEPLAIAEALRLAAADDDLVDSAAILNAQVIAERLDADVLRPRIRAVYEELVASGGMRRP